MRIRKSISLLVLMGLLAACQPGENPQAAAVPSATPTLVATATVEVQAPTETPTPEPTITPTTEPTPSFPPDLVCDEVLCTGDWNGLLARPIGPDGNQTIDPSYAYASTRNHTLDPHHGVEFPNGSGTPVLAAQDGEVVFAGTDALTLLGPYTSFYGNVIILRHAGLYAGRDLYTLYGHLSELDVSEGQTVSQGEVIGKVGMTGVANGAHLHFEVRLDENDYAHTTNPILWLTPMNPETGGEGAVVAGLLLDDWDEPIDQFTIALEALNPDGSKDQTYYPVTYFPAGVNANPVLGENFTMADLPAGDYRLTYISNGYKQVIFTLEPGSIGFIKLPPE